MFKIDFGDYVIKVMGNIMIYVGKQVVIQLGFYVMVGLDYYVFIREDCMLGVNKLQVNFDKVGSKENDIDYQWYDEKRMYGEDFFYVFFNFFLGIVEICINWVIGCYWVLNLMGVEVIFGELDELVSWQIYLFKGYYILFVFFGNKKLYK